MVACDRLMEMIMTVTYDNEGYRIDPTFRENCVKCAGRGHFIAWSGRNLGKCFACDGVGHKIYKTDAATRAKGREKAAQRKVDNAAKNEAWVAEAYPAQHAWLVAKAPTFSFAQSLLDASRTYGELTDAQVAAIDKCIARDAERKAAADAREAAAPTLTTDKLFAAFDKARSAGLKYPKLHLQDLTISPAGANSKNAGSLYVKNGEAYLGKITGQRFFASRDCSESAAQTVASVISDPLAAAVAFGKTTGRCCCCGRELTDPVSVEKGIGPICEANWF